MKTNPERPFDPDKSGVPLEVREKYRLPGFDDRPDNAQQGCEGLLRGRNISKGRLGDKCFRLSLDEEELGKIPIEKIVRGFLDVAQNTGNI